MARVKRAKPVVTEILNGIQPLRSNGKRRLLLTTDQRELLEQNRQAEELVSLFLDPDQDRTNRQIAEAMGMSLSKMKRLTQTDAFRDAYEATIVEIGHSPRLKNVRSSIDEMLPVAARVMRSILLDPTAPAGVRLKAATTILEYAPKEAGSGDQIKEFQNFLSTFATKANAVTVTVPDSYSEAMKQFADLDVVDAVAVDLPSEETTI